MARLLCLVTLLLAALPARAGALPAGVVTVEVVAVRGDTVVLRTKSPRKAFLYSFVPVAGAYSLSAIAALAEGPCRPEEFDTDGCTPSALTTTVTTLSGLVLFIGPAFGHFYAENNRGALTGIVVRAGALGMVAAGFILAVASSGDADFDASKPALGVGLAITGAAVYVGSMAYDIATAGAAARRFNERQQRRVQMSLSPVVGRHQGVRLAMRF